MLKKIQLEISLNLVSVSVSPVVTLTVSVYVIITHFKLLWRHKLSLEDLRLYSVTLLLTPGLQCIDICHSVISDAITRWRQRRKFSNPTCNLGSRSQFDKGRVLTVASNLSSSHSNRKYGFSSYKDILVKNTLNTAA